VREKVKISTISIDPKQASTHFGLATALDGAGKNEDAIAALRAGIKAAPKNAGLHLQLGRLLNKQTDWDGAAAAFREALSLDPKHAGALTGLAVALYRQGEIDDAIAVLRAAIDAAPKTVGLHVLLGQLLNKQADWSAATAAFRAALAIDPHHSGLLTGLVVALDGSDQFLGDNELAAALVNSPDAFRKYLPRLEKIFSRHHWLDNLVDLIWRHRALVMDRVSVVGTFMRMCAKSSRREALTAQLREWLLSDLTPPLRFSEADIIGNIPGLSEEQLSVIYCAKYRALMRSPASSLLDLVDEFAGMVEITPPLSNFLFRKRRDTKVEQTQWLHDMQTAIALDHFLVDTCRVLPFARRSHVSLKPYFECLFGLAAIEKCVDMAQAKRFFEDLRSPRGQLLFFFHGGFAMHLTVLFARLVPDHLIFHLYDNGSPHSIASGKLTAAFQAVKAIQQQRMVLIPADGSAFNSSSTEITVLGTPVHISSGAALIAYEASCDTGWYTVVREGDRFVPVYKAGPSRQTGERFAEYKDRWMRFFAAEIEQVLTGNAKNLAIRLGWSRLWSRSDEPA
jgi:Flp pilus assembly protein TadD